MNGAEGQDHVTEGPAPVDPFELERLWGQMLAFLAGAFFVIGAAGAGLVLAFTGSLWALACFMPGWILISAALTQRIRIALQKDGR